MRNKTHKEMALYLIDRYKMHYTHLDAFKIAKKSAILYVELQLEQPQSIESSLYWEDVLKEVEETQPKSIVDYIKSSINEISSIDQQSLYQINKTLDFAKDYEYLYLNPKSIGKQ
jgi:hypothetical protein